MTTIAFRGGVLAADTACCYGGSMLDGVSKIFRGPHGPLGGAAGMANYCSAFRAWAESGCEGSPPEPKEGDSFIDRGVLFFPDGLIEAHEPGGILTLRPRYYAFGSGKSEALGAMFAGADAETAVAAAIAHDPHTGGRVEVLRMESPE